MMKQQKKIKAYTSIVTVQRKEIKQKHTLRHRLPLAGILCLVVLYASAQSYMAHNIKSKLYTTETQQNNTPKDSTSARKDSTQKVSKKGEPKLINLVYSSLWKKRQGSEVEVLIDSVQFFHDGAYLFCDSAHFNRISNTFEAFSNVRMEQGDTIFLYGSYMHYDGNTRLARVRENVKMDHRSGTLFTDSLNYDRVKNIGYYFDGGMLVDSLNELTSIRGQYEPNKSLATFSDEVVLDNPNFKLYSDTLLYSTDTRIAQIISPSKIESDSGIIHSSRGWYNTLTERSLLLDQSTVWNKAGDRSLKGDSIIFYRNNNSGEVFGNMFMQDTTKRVILTGHYGFYDGTTDYAFATDSAQAIEYSQGDSLYLHADTLKLIKLPPAEVLTIRQTRDTLRVEVNDTLSTDSIIIHVDSIREIKSFHEIKGYYGVRFYRSDMQGVCDSLQFNSSDSVLRMYKDPILWSENRQLTGDTIHMFMNDSTIDRMYIVGSAYSIEQKDSIHFNQLKSKLLNFYFEDGGLRRVFAEGNVQTIAYPEEKDGKLNEIQAFLECSYLEIWMLKDGGFDKMKGWPSPSGTATPFHLLIPEKRRLENFFWYEYLRPLDKGDIFRKVERKTEDKRPPRASYWNREE